MVRINTKLGTYVTVFFSSYDFLLMYEAAIVYQTNMFDTHN